MKTKKGIVIGIVSIIVLISAVIFYFILNRQDSNTTLNIMDKQWIEANKNKLVDIEITNNVPIFNYNGEGVLFDFLSSFEKNIGIEFNRVALKQDSKDTYAFRIVDKAGKNDLLMYRDNYVLVSSIEGNFSNVSAIGTAVVGVLTEDLENAAKYLNGSPNITFKAYDDYDSLLASITSEVPETSYILILKNLYLSDIIDNNLYINYNLSDYTKDYVLTLGDVDKLNSIIKKYFKKWYAENYKKSYQNNFSDSYFIFNGISERDKVDFTSKRYSYGFVAEAPYNILIDDNLIGINASLLRGFSRISGVEISFEEFSSKKDLLKKFNENKIDFFFNDMGVEEYDMDVRNTVSSYDEKIVYVSHIDNDIIVNSVYSLIPYEVKVIKDSIISSYLKDREVKVKEYNNINDLLDSIDTNSIIAINYDTYNYYVRSSLIKYKIDFIDTLNKEYTFTIRDINDNNVFSDFFNFYLSFVDEKSLVSTSYNKLMTVKTKKSIITSIVLYFFALIGLATFIYKIVSLFLISRKKKNTLSKEHKLKYVDMLTSLKNRNYLNDNIEKWDSSEVYPQTIIVIDLNNVAYINDNYGHQEGDSLIKEAANILIKTQISNTEIIRTNGNEFLVYMVGYDEKQVISYIRKLNREFKELAHGFGAAIGYSIISDAIKTIDDAVNEATLDMRNNKEEIQG